MSREPANHSPDRRLPIVDEQVLHPLRPSGVVGQHLVAVVGDELLVSNDQLIGPGPRKYPVQAYPG